MYKISTLLSIHAAHRIAILSIVVITAIFYFWALDRNDVVTDEASYMARGIGMLDFNFGINQPTPLQWVQSVPWWMKLSFHDHPLLVFFVEYLSFNAFGENVFAGRIPAAFAGVVSVVLLYFISRELYSPSVSLVAASLFASTVGHVWISRVALQESIVIALMLTASFFFIRSLREKRWLIAVGVFLGLAVLAKYTALVLIPVFLTVLFLKRHVFSSPKNFYFLISIFCFLVVISPIVIYNLGLYRTFSHFDFQFSYVFGQKVLAWSEMPGKEDVGSLADRIRDYAPALFTSNSPLFLLLSLGGLFLVMKRVFAHAVLVSFLIWLVPFMLFIGPTARFLSMIIPWLSIAAAFYLVSISEFIWARVGTFKSEHFGIPKNVGMFFPVLLVFIFEIFYSYNSVIAFSPVGSAPWTYAEGIRRSNNNWGYNQLEHFVSSEFKGKRPETAVSFDYPVIVDFLNQGVEKDIKKNFEPEGWMFVYNGNQALGPQLWIFLRRAVYHGWPVADAETYRRILAEKGSDYFTQIGVREVYFVQNAKNVLVREVRKRPLTNDGDILEGELKGAGVKPYREIKNLRGETAFFVYKSTL